MHSHLHWISTSIGWLNDDLGPMFDQLLYMVWCKRCSSLPRVDSFPPYTKNCPLQTKHVCNCDVHF